MSYESEYEEQVLEILSIEGMLKHLNLELDSEKKKVTFLLQKIDILKRTISKLES